MYIVCQSEKFANVFMCALIINILSNLLNGTLLTLLTSGIISIMGLLLTTFISSLITFAVYKISSSFLSFVIYNFLVTLVLAFIIVGLGLSLSGITIGSSLLKLIVSIILLILVIGGTIYVVMKKRDIDNFELPEEYNKEENNIEELNQITPNPQVDTLDKIPSATPKGCPKCGRAVDGNLNNCPYCGYKFAELNIMYEKAIMEKDIHNNM